MLARLQLAAVARREGLPLHTIERDYVQHLLLRHVATKPFAFKGGTCLRIAYGSARYSEDLDFNADGAPEEALAHLSGAARRLLDYGIASEAVRRPAREGIHAVLRYSGPLFDGSAKSRGSIRIDISLRRESVDVGEVFVPRTPYPDVPQLVLRALTPEHLLAEKARALVVRRKPRDAYDVHFLLRRGARCTRTMLDEKMRLYRRRFTLSGLEEGLRVAGETWSRDLGPLLGQVPPFDPVAEEIRVAFRDILERA